MTNPKKNPRHDTPCKNPLQIKPCILQRYHHLISHRPRVDRYPAAHIHTQHCTSCRITDHQCIPCSAGVFSALQRIHLQKARLQSSRYSDPQLCTVNCRPYYKRCFTLHHLFQSIHATMSQPKKYCLLSVGFLPVQFFGFSRRGVAKELAILDRYSWLLFPTFLSAYYYLHVNLAPSVFAQIFVRFSNKLFTLLSNERQSSIPTSRRGKSYLINSS